MSSGGRALAASLSKGGAAKAVLSSSSSSSATPKSPVLLLAPPVRTGVTTTSGGFQPEPIKVPGGIAGVGATVAVGLLLGAGISKNIASFLEENELFVPSDDDDDD